MIGFIIISALLLCGVITLLAILFMRPSEVPISDKSIDLSAVLPIQTITDSVIVNGSGDLTIGYRLFLPEVFTLSQEDAKYIHERLEGLFKMLPPATVVHQQCFFYLSNKIDVAYTKALVLDTSGQVYDVAAIESAAMRKYEYENHIKTFVSLWYSFDESTYEDNVTLALNLIGNRGKELYNEYNDINMLNSLIQKNIRYGVIIKDIHINMQTVPISGDILFTQTGYRARGSVARDISVNFTLYDVSRSRENSHGVKIESWEVRYSEPREITDEEKLK